MRLVYKLLIGALLLLALFWVQRQWRCFRALDQGLAAAATRLWPANAAAWRLRSQQEMFDDPTAATAAARRAAAASPDDWSNWAALAQVQAETGDLSGARASMGEMAGRARGYQAHWRYANLLLLSGDAPGFWSQTGLALRFAPISEMPATLNQIWQVANGDAAAFDRAVRPAVGQNPALALGTLNFLLGQGRLDLAAPWWTAALAATPAAQLASAANQYLELLAEAAESGPARSVWRQALAAGVLPAAEGPSVNNLVATADAGALGWNLCHNCGPWASDERGTLSFGFQGNQADQLLLAHQWLLLAPATTYHLGFQQRYEVAGLALPGAASTNTGIRVQVANGEGQILRDGAGAFATPAAPAAVQLRVSYARPLAQPPARGTVTISDLRVQ